MVHHQMHGVHLGQKDGIKIKNGVIDMSLEHLKNPGWIDNIFEAIRYNLAVRSWRCSRSNDSKGIYGTLWKSFQR